MLTSIAVIHLPHASTLVPGECRTSLLLNDEALAHELLRMTDAFTDDIFALDDATTVRFPVSRLVVDPERFVDDAQERMADRGMGVIYTRTATGAPLRALPSAEERSHLLATWYWPHHDRLTRAVDRALAAHGRCFLIDAHSFPASPLPYELDQALDRPEICLGSDPYHTPPRFLELAVAGFKGAGFSVEVDRPFAGALVPLAHYHRDPRVIALMVEVRRDLYMDEKSGQRRADFAELARRVQQVVHVLMQQVGVLEGSADMARD